MGKIVCGALMLLMLNACGYNTFQTRDEGVKAAWSQVVNLYQKRADLIPNLVGVVQGYAGHEKGTLTAVVEARSKATSIQVTPQLANDAAALAKWQKAQGDFTQALSRLMVVSEQYPDLKANKNFLDLQQQLRSVENQLAKARENYIHEIRGYNMVVRQFPTNLTAMFFHYTEKPQFALENEKELTKPPVVNFSGVK